MPANQSNTKTDIFWRKSALHCRFDSYGMNTSNMGHLFVVGEFVVVSHSKIFPLQLLGPADKPMASSSSSKGKI